MATENLALETVPSDPFAAANAANRNAEKIDTAVGGITTDLGAIADLDILDAADGDPVDGDLAAKLAALEARVIVLEAA